ncbi:MAG: hypothetical protein ACK5RO_13295 [Pseudobdellovibrionaceae bacterium]
MSANIEYLNGRALCSTRNPEQEAQKWLEQQVWGPQNCILGLGAGYHLLAIPQDAGETVVYEPYPDLVSRFKQRVKDPGIRIVTEISELQVWAEQFPFVQIFRPAWNGREDELKTAEAVALFLNSKQASQQASKWGFPQTAQQFAQFDFDQWYFSIKNYRPNLSQKKHEEDVYWTLLREFIK